MPDYKNSKIYKIISNSTDEVYYGGTVQKLSRRMTDHKASYKLWMKDKKKYASSYEIIKHGDAKIILVEKYSCNDKDELRARERYYIENNNCVNKFIPIRFPHEMYGLKKQYREDNKEEIKLRKKRYYQSVKVKHKDKFKANHKRYYETNKDKIKVKSKKYREDHREEIKVKHKNWRENNKDTIKVRHKQYYEEHKKDILQRSKDRNREEVNRKARERYAIRKQDKKDRLFYIKLLPLL